MKIETETTFSFDALKDQIKQILKDERHRNLEKIAEKAKDNIKKGNFAKLGNATKKIRKEGLSPKARRKTDSEKPLIHTGKLLNSIKATKTGIRMNKYGTYHLEETTTVKNSFTRWYYRKFRSSIDGIKVPKRDFMPSTSDLGAQPRKRIIKLIRNALKK